MRPSCSSPACTTSCCANRTARRRPLLHGRDRPARRSTRPQVWEAFRELVLDHADEIETMMTDPLGPDERGRAIRGRASRHSPRWRRSTSARSASIELGSSAGLNLLFDRYRIDYAPDRRRRPGRLAGAPALRAARARAGRRWPTPRRSDRVAPRRRPRARRRPRRRRRPVASRLHLARRVQARPSGSRRPSRWPARIRPSCGRATSSTCSKRRSPPCPRMRSPASCRPGCSPTSASTPAKSSTGGSSPSPPAARWPTSPPSTR